MSRQHVSLHRAGRGFTLIELMVAMLLGLIVIAGVSSVFLANLRSYHTNEALSEVQSNSRIAFELMARDIRQAGLTGCNSTGGRVANVLDQSTPHWWSNWNNAVHGYGGADSGDATDQTDPAVDIGTAEAERVAGTDSLMVIGAAGRGMSVEEDKEPAANFKLNDKSTDLETGDIIIVCDPDHATIVQISDYNDSNVTVVHNTGNKVSPGNCSKGLGYPTDCDKGNFYTFGSNSNISKMAAHDWYIGNNPVGGRSLYRMEVDTQSGVAKAVARELVRNVTNMQITYHQPGVEQFKPADQVPVSSWDSVDAVRITFTVQSVDQRAGTDANPLERSFTSTTTIRNRVN